MSAIDYMFYFIFMNRRFLLYEVETKYTLFEVDFRKIEYLCRSTKYDVANQFKPFQDVSYSFLQT